MGIQKINQMYKDYFGLEGCDGTGAPIINLVNPGNNIPTMGGMPFNAYAAGNDFVDANGQNYFLMVFGMGTLRTLEPATTSSWLWQQHLSM